MFFISQNLKHVHMIYFFLELLIFFWLTLVNIYTSKNAVYKYKLQRKPRKQIVMKQIDTNRYTFSLVSDNDVEKSCFFFSFRVNIPDQQLIIFLSFIMELERIFRLYYSSVVSRAPF